MCVSVNIVESNDVITYLSFQLILRLRFTVINYHWQICNAIGKPEVALFTDKR